MTTVNYCLDANVLIQAWQKYYSPKFCPDFRDILIELGNKKRIFVPQMVYEEITRSEDDLSKWIKNGNLPVRKIDEKVTDCLKEIYFKDPIHMHLVDNIKQRSLADPWIIAHAINEEATVVTQENKETVINSKRIKKPNVCENMGVRWINDFQMIEELEIQFNCILKEN